MATKLLQIRISPFEATGLEAFKLSKLSKTPQGLNFKDWVFIPLHTADIEAGKKILLEAVKKKKWSYASLMQGQKEVAFYPLDFDD